MIKLAILGIDNSHAWTFAGALAGKDGKKLFEDVELIGIYGDFETKDGQVGKAEVEKVSSCTNFTDNYNAFLDEADAVMVTARYGANHFKFAKEYIKKGIPVWIDKPFTCDKKELLEMLAFAKKYNSPITGGSVLPMLKDMVEFKEEISKLEKPITGGHVTAPVNMVNPYGNFWFYTQHLVQMMTFVFGNNVKSVYAEQDKNGVYAIYHYEDFSVTARFGTDYSISLYSGAGDLNMKHISFGSNYFIPELESFYKVIKTGKSELTDIDFIAPIYIIDATKRAFEKKKTVKVKLPL